MIFENENNKQYFVLFIILLAVNIPIASRKLVPKITTCDLHAPPQLNS